MTIRNSFIKEDVLLKIVGYSALIIVSLVGWMLLTIYNMNGTVNTINTNIGHIGETVEKNYVILQSKADEKENKTAHDFLISETQILKTQVATLDRKIDRNFDQRIRYTVVPKVDSVKYILQANSGKLDTIQNYTTQIKDMLIVNTVKAIPYKEVNDLVINLK